MSGMSRNLMGPYPRGVPTPRAVHVHPYPTRFHGTINTRPMFSLPFQYQPHAVFKPDDFSRSTDGLGTLQYTTGRGIFKPGGDGGGIFDGNISGLGNYSLSTLPWSTYNDGTKQYQGELNVALRNLGQSTVTEDGKLGPATCDAALKVKASPEYGWPVPNECNKSHTVATPTAPTMPALDPTQATLIPGGGMSRMSSTTKNALVFVGAGAVALGAAYFFLKKRG